MGLNDFVSLFYGSAQSLNAASTLAAVDVVGGRETSTFNRKSTLEMLKNHKNSKLPKFNLNEFASSDVKFSRNMTLSSMKPPRHKGSGGGGGGVGSGSVGSGVNKFSNDSCSNVTPASAITKHSSKQTAAASAVSTTSTAAVATPSTLTACSEMDLLRAPGLRKKSSFLWNSFRMPRKQKGKSAKTVMESVRE